MAKKKRAAKKKAAKKTAKKRGRAKKAAKKKSRKDFTRPPGYKRRRGSGILVPASHDDGTEVVSPKLMEKGIAEAKKQMKEMVYELSEELGDGFNVSQLEFEASFSADGKFMGFGVGGAATFRIKVDIESDHEN